MYLYLCGTAAVGILLDYQFHNDYLTFGVAGLMGLTGGVFFSREGHG